MEEVKKTNKDELRKTIKEMIKTYESLPQHALITPITHYDYLSMLLMLEAIMDLDP